jgi:phosphatidylglycerol lysyltransferase
VEIKESLKKQFRIRPEFGLQFVCIFVGIYGAYIIADSLLAQLMAHRGTHLTNLLVDFPILIGISVIYLSTLLWRRKRTAWIVTVLAYAFYMGVGFSEILSRINTRHFNWIAVLRSIVFPAIILFLLFILRKSFVVKSDIQGFRFALRFVLIMFMVTIIYGVAGFELMDESDFHQEISWGSGLHYTLDQFNLTTNKPVHPYTRRAHLFVDSLSFISTIAVIYALLSLFQPLKARLSDQSLARQRVLDLLITYGGVSEEFFKLWPHDKHYFFDDSHESVMAFHVYRGVALCVSDPVGNPSRFPSLVNNFDNLCFNNDWLPALVHVGDEHVSLYEKEGYSLQKLGQEAIVDINHFNDELKDSKYFRQIINRFNKQGYSFELLTPPHHQAILDRLKTISDEWLSKGSRAERGFVMGYFTTDYMQQCVVAVARDAANTIQAFANIVPAEFDNEEATYDMLRQSDKALSNVTDYLLTKLMEKLKDQDYLRLNMGLSPLAGLDEIDNEEKTILDNVLKFAYANGDRFFSFSGLYKFKAKYEPTWHDKYIGYKGGIRGFSRTMTALTRCMSKVVKLKN